MYIIYIYMCLYICIGADLLERAAQGRRLVAGILERLDARGVGDREALLEVAVQRGDRLVGVPVVGDVRLRRGNLCHLLTRGHEVFTTHDQKNITRGIRWQSA